MEDVDRHQGGHLGVLNMCLLEEVRRVGFGKDWLFTVAEAWDT